MGAEKNKRTAIEFLDASAKHEADRLASLMAEDATYWIQGVTRLFKHAGEKSKAQIHAYMKTPSIFKDGLDQQIGHVTAEDDRVSVEVSVKGAVPDGRVYENTYHYLFLFEGDLIRTVKEYVDTAVAAEMFN